MPSGDDADEDGGKSYLLPADHATRPVAEWMCEAALLPEQIELVLECDGAVEQTEEIFREVVQRDAAWQTALGRAVGFEIPEEEEDGVDDDADSRAGVDVDAAEVGADVGATADADLDADLIHADADARARRALPIYHCDGFPELLRLMCDGDATSRTRCDGFDPGCLWDDEQIELIVDEKSSLDGPEWMAAWSRNTVGFETGPPLPPWKALLTENVMPLEQSPPMMSS